MTTEVCRFRFGVNLRDNELKELHNVKHDPMTLGEIADLELDYFTHPNIYLLIDKVHDTLDISLLDVPLGRMKFKSTASIVDDNSLELSVVLQLD